MDRFFESLGLGGRGGFDFGIPDRLGRLWRFRIVGGNQLIERDESVPIIQQLQVGQTSSMAMKP